MISMHRHLHYILTALALHSAASYGQALITPGVTQELAAGDMLPDIELTNELGATIHVSDFRGKALAISFIYSRCPSATLCPMVSRNFDIAQTLLARLDANAQCHLLSISLDPENDTPEVLAAYAKGFHAETQLWTFATGREDRVRKLGEAVGLEFKRIGGRIDHNLRTVVVDSTGCIHHVFRGDTWTPQELVAELRGAVAAHR